ncbi:MAG: nuclear transport factor 2 family protein [Ilumatobacteraceae bacterium]
MSERSDPDRIRDLESREAIRQIFTDYAKYLDSSNFAGYASLFASDGVMQAQLGQAVGPAQIEKVLDENLGAHVRGHLPQAVHVMNNQRIDIDPSGDTATTDVIWFYLTTDPDGVPTVLQSGRYQDDLVRENGAWKIKRHDISRIMGRSPMDPAPTTVIDRLAARLQVLEDKDAIWNLFMTYKRHLDARDFRAYASLFTDDAVWGGNLGRAVGPKEIEELLVRTLEVYPSDLERTHHLVMNPVITVDGDSAKAKSNWGYMTRSETDAPVFEMLGRYSDELRRTPDGWKFSRRIAYSDIPYISLDGII